MSQATNIATQLVNDNDALSILKEHLGPGFEPVSFLNKRADDLGQPTKALVSNLNLIEEGDPEAPTFFGTPFGKQVITSGATFITKLTTGAFSLAGLGAAIYTFYEGFPAGSDRPVLWACATVLLAVVALTVALIVRADVMGRAMAMAAEYNARAQVASAYLKANEDLLQEPGVTIVR
jgi:hypothetical protein